MGENNSAKRTSCRYRLVAHKVDADMGRGGCQNDEGNVVTHQQTRLNSIQNDVDAATCQFLSAR